MARAHRWRRWIRPTIPALLEALLLVGIVAAPAQAGYQASVDVNESAFQPPCIGFIDSYPSKMLKAAGERPRTPGKGTRLNGRRRRRHRLTTSTASRRFAVGVRFETCAAA